MSGLYDELRIALHGIWQRRWLALAVAWGLCAVGWAIVSLIPSRYESSARVLVEASALPDRIGGSPAERQRTVDRVRQTLTSGATLERVVRDTGLAGPSPNDQEVGAAVTKLQPTIRIVAQQDNLFVISAAIGLSGRSDAANAAHARAVVEQLIAIFAEENAGGGQAATAQALRVIDAQLAERQAALLEAERIEGRMGALLPGTGTPAERMQTARAELAQIESQLVAARSALAAVDAQMNGAQSGAAPTAGPAAARLAVLEGQLADARARGWTDNHPDVVAIRAQMSAARTAASSERGAGVTGAPGTLYISLRSMQAERQASAAALAARRDQLQGDLNALMARQAADPAAAASGRDYRVLRDEYDKLVADREQLKLRGLIETGAGATSLRVLDGPSLPTAPAAPNRPLLLAMVLAVGLGGGIAAAFALGQLRTTFPTAARLEKASGLPVIGALGAVVTDAALGRQRREHRLFAGGVAALGGAFALLVMIDAAGRGAIA